MHALYVLTWEPPRGFSVYECMDPKKSTILASVVASGGLSYPLWPSPPSSVEVMLTERAEPMHLQDHLFSSPQQIETLPDAVDSGWSYASDTGWNDAQDTGFGDHWSDEHNTEDTGPNFWNDTGLGDDDLEAYYRFNVTVTDPYGEIVPYPIRISTFCHAPRSGSITNEGRSNGEMTMILARISMRSQERCEVKAYRADTRDLSETARIELNPTARIQNIELILE